MSDIRQNILWPNSGLNSDDSLEYVPSGDGRIRRNILVAGDEANGLITNMLGNTRTVDIAEHELVLSNCYKVIGSYYNRLTRKVYYFIFSQPYEITEAAGATTSTTTTTTTTETPGGGLVVDYTAGEFQYDNYLLCYIEDTQELETIFIDTHNYFGLHYDYPMRDITMIGNWLYFNPRVSEPKMIDVEMAYNYTNYDAYDAALEYIYGDYVTFHGGLFRANQAITFGETPVTDIDKWDRIGDSYQYESNLTGFDSEFRYAFNVIKQCPVARPALRYGSDTEINSNNVRQRVFRFSHRLKYFDNSYSVFSSYSDVALPEEDEYYNGEIINNPTLNNYINVTVQLHSPALIKEIEIVAQQIGESWRRVEIINRREQALLTDSTYVYAFYNDEAYDEVDDSLLLKIYDSVPRTANSQEIINKNILCYGGVKEGFDNLPKEDIDVSLTPEIQEFEVSTGYAGFKRNSIGAGDITYGALPAATWDVGAVWAAAGLVADDMVLVMLNGVLNYATFVNAEILTAVALTAKMDALLTEWYPSFNFVTVGTTIECYIVTQGDTIVFDAAAFYTPVGAGASLTKKRGFKTGADHPFCIYYYDDNLRRWDAQTSKENTHGVGYEMLGTTVYVPTYNELAVLPTDTNNRWIVNWEVSHLPPAGAKYWRWGYAGNSLCSDFVQYIISGITDGAFIDAEENMSIIDITPLQTLKYTTEADAGVAWNQFPASNISPYEWQKGDRIRFITQAGDPDTPATDLGAMVDGVIDMEIIKQNIDDNTIYVQLFNHALAGIGECSLVEIYTPLKETSREVYYEFGGLLRIIEDSAGVLVHEGGDGVHHQSTATGNPAMGVFNYGDIYHVLRTPSKLLDVADPHQGAFHESMWWSDFYDSDDWDKGKSGVESSFNERDLNIIRYSNPYFQNTQINGLPTFEPENYKELNDVFGNIVSIYEVGDTLKCYQERKASSILIGRTQYTDAEGNETVAISTSVLGAIRYSPSNYSTVFPESISRNNKFVYGFDIYNGVMWRDGVNGIFPISGRYSEAGGDSDYKMATWFKDISKALLVSGIRHTDVMSVWDEEFKNLHVTFVDYANVNNNETIVFHEPSNRWITFQDLHQTPPSYNVMLECETFEILSGFVGGLGYSFDEDTRFAMFNITTGSDVESGGTGTGIGGIEFAMTVPTPTVTVSAELGEDEVDFVMTVPTPVTTISYVWLSTSALEWQYDEYYPLGVKIGTVTTNQAYATITSLPTWLTIFNFGSPLSLGGTVGNGDDLNLFPTVENKGVELSGTFTITDPVGNTASITVIHRANPTGPVANVYATIPPPLIITDNGCTATFGSANININFTPDHPDYTMGQNYSVNYNILKNGGNVGSGSFTVYEQQANNKALIMGSTASNGDIISVYLQYNS